MPSKTNKFGKICCICRRQWERLSQLEPERVMRFHKWVAVESLCFVQIGWNARCLFALCVGVLGCWIYILFTILNIFPLVRLPTGDPKTSRKWIKAVRKAVPNFKPQGEARICYLHFQRSDYKFTVNNDDKYLKRGVVPSLYLFPINSETVDELIATKKSKKSVKFAKNDENCTPCTGETVSWIFFRVFV